jgi:hypothetical protein
MVITPMQTMPVLAAFWPPFKIKPYYHILFDCQASIAFSLPQTITYPSAAYLNQHRSCPAWKLLVAKDAIAVEQSAGL